jgi:hypothetical protein
LPPGALPGLSAAKVKRFFDDTEENPVVRCKIGRPPVYYSSTDEEMALPARRG